jgi:integrase/recombinase XerD
MDRYPKSEYTPATRATYFASLSSFFDYCLRRGVLKKNYVKFTWRPKVPKNLEPKSLSEEERARAFVALPSLPIRDRVVIELGFATGLRRSELSNVRWSDINLEQRTLKTIGKGKHFYEVVFSQRCAFMLEELRKSEPHSEYVFLNKYGQKLGDKSIYDICIMFGKKIKTDKPMNPHRMRHSHATQLLRSGASYRVIQKQLGHQNSETTQIYARLSNEGLRQKYQMLIG